jgi:hypothetical protein
MERLSALGGEGVALIPDGPPAREMGKTRQVPKRSAALQAALPCLVDSGLVQQGGR